MAGEYKSQNLQAQALVAEQEHFIVRKLDCQYADNFGCHSAIQS